VDDALLDGCEQLAEEQGKSRSEALAEAMRFALRQFKLRKIVERGLAETGGPSTPKERAAARRRLGHARG
jgi:hypothetical protein